MEDIPLFIGQYPVPSGPTNRQIRSLTPPTVFVSLTLVLSVCPIFHIQTVDFSLRDFPFRSFFLGRGGAREGEELGSGHLWS